MKGNININISNSIKSKMLIIKDQKKLSLSYQINAILLNFISLPLNQRVDDFCRWLNNRDPSDSSTLTLQKKYLGNEKELRLFFELLKLKHPKITFKGMIALIVEGYIKNK